LKPEGFQNEFLAQQLDRDMQVGWFASEQKKDDAMTSVE